MQPRNDLHHAAGGGPAHPAGRDRSLAEAPADPGYDDPWYDALASNWGEAVAPGTPAAAAPSTRPDGEPAPRGAADVYLEVQRSTAFREVRGRYRGFVVPAVTGFFLWYVAYVVTATTAPGLMARPVAGAVNVAMIAGLGQFLTTFLLTWAYARHARLRRDKAALDLRWDTQELTRALRGGTS
ncbi:DUF485 domain-containing protein [Streptomyces sp. SCSIO 75703]|uniref:DUF485 domain-containing protein n=1 Tax=unclassified Streptomyces TaxID=2593676 RepID=UPI0004C19F84|nr:MULTISPECIES: DUF485 domain-containing protein [unclassified Streptomyces]